MDLVTPRQQQSLVEVHEEAHLVHRTLPVLGAERVDGEIADAGVAGAPDDIHQGLLARRVAFGARQPPALGPPAVAVHHDRHVTGQATRVEVGELHRCTVPAGALSARHRPVVSDGSVSGDG